MVVEVARESLVIGTASSTDHRFRQALEARGLTVQGITTDGSTLYPEPIAAVFGAVPHQSANSTSCTR